MGVFMCSKEDLCFVHIIAVPFIKTVLEPIFLSKFSSKKTIFAATFLNHLKDKYSAIHKNGINHASLFHEPNTLFFPYYMHVTCYWYVAVLYSQVSHCRNVLWKRWRLSERPHESLTSFSPRYVEILIYLWLCLLIIWTVSQWLLHNDGFMQERCNSSANALELLLSCTNPLIRYVSIEDTSLMLCKLYKYCIMKCLKYEYSTFSVHQKLHCLLW